MERVERPNGSRKGFEGAFQHRRDQLNDREPGEQGAGVLAVGSAKASGVEPGPDLVLDEAAGHERLRPQPGGGDPVLGEELCERHRRVQVDHRASRSPRRSSSNSARDMIGALGGALVSGASGGVSHPLRTASARSASDSNSLRPACGGASSATTRSRSVTSTVSPPDARRTYSLSLFLITLRPTARMVSYCSSWK